MRRPVRARRITLGTSARHPCTRPCPHPSSRRSTDRCRSPHRSGSRRGKRRTTLSSCHSTDCELERTCRRPSHCSRRRSSTPSACNSARRCCSRPAARRTDRYLGNRCRSRIGLRRRRSSPGVGHRRLLSESIGITDSWVQPFSSTMGAIVRHSLPVPGRPGSHGTTKVRLIGSSSRPAPAAPSVSPVSWPFVGVLFLLNEPWFSVAAPLSAYPLPPACIGRYGEAAAKRCPPPKTGVAEACSFAPPNRAPQGKCSAS